MTFQLKYNKFHSRKCISKCRLQNGSHFALASCVKQIFINIDPADAVAPTLTHWGRVTHICVCELTTIGSDNSLSPGRRQAFIWTNAGILLIGPLGTNFSEILIEIDTFSSKKIHLKMLSGKWRPFCLGLNVLTGDYQQTNWLLPILEVTLSKMAVEI